MNVAEEMPVEAILKGSAAKVLLHLMSRGGAPGTNAEMMRGSGVHDRNTYYVARDQLKRFGLWENPYRFFQQVQGITQQGDGKIPAGGGYFPAGVGNNPAPRIRATLEADVVKAPQPEALLTLYEGHPLAGVEEPVNWRTRMAEADLLPTGGDWRDGQSANNVRRRAQIQALQDAWTAHFGQKLIEAAAKGLLQRAGDSAEGVYDQIEYVLAQPKKIEFPLRYIERVLDGQKVKQASAPSVRPVEIGKPDTQDYLMDKPSERTARIEARLRAMGKLEEDDDD